jgi:hypothetical protein
LTAPSRDGILKYIGLGGVMSYNKLEMPKFNIKESSLGSADIIYKEETYFLYNNGKQWMSFSENNKHQIAEFYSQYDQAYGDVLLSGLGFGILPIWLSSKPEVTSVTVVEISNDVIDLFLLSNDISNKINIINQDILKVTTEKKYDCLFLDHYEKEDWPFKLKNIKEICSKINHDVFWAWSLEKEYLLQFFDVKNTYIFESTPDLSLHWEQFIKKNLPNETHLLKISNKIINEYLYTYCDRSNLLEEN